MNLSTAFDIRDKVKIKELDWPATVIAIFITKHGIEYQVRYFNNSKVEIEYFFEEELIRGS
jgi:hypothetical protein